MECPLAYAPIVLAYFFARVGPKKKVKLRQLQAASISVYGYLWGTFFVKIKVGNYLYFSFLGHQAYDKIILICFVL